MSGVVHGGTSITTLAEEDDPSLDSHPPLVLELHERDPRDEQAARPPRAAAAEINARTGLWTTTEAELVGGDAAGRHSVEAPQDDTADPVLNEVLPMLPERPAAQPVRLREQAPPPQSPQTSAPQTRWIELFPDGPSGDFVPPSTVRLNGESVAWSDLSQKNREQAEDAYRETYTKAHDERADQEAAAAAWREKVAAVEWKDPEVPIVVSEGRCVILRTAEDCRMYFSYGGLHPYFDDRCNDID